MSEKKTKKTKEVEKDEKKAVKKTEEAIVEKKEVKKRTRKTKKVLLDKIDQKRYKVLSKIIKIFTKIGKIVLMICVPFVFLGMIITPIIFKNFEIESNIIKFNDATMILGEDNLTIKIADETEVIEYEQNSMDNIIRFFNENSKTSIIIFIELALLLIAIFLIIEIYMLQYVEKIFDNFLTKKTPFIEENTNYILKIAILLSIVKFMNLCLSMADLSILNYNTLGILEILMVYVLYFIFKYATQLQLEKETQITE